MSEEHRKKLSEIKKKAVLEGTFQSPAKRLDVQLKMHKKHLTYLSSGIKRKKLQRTKEHNRKISEGCKKCLVIHHINGNHYDNSPENRVVLTPSEHAKIHLLQGDIHIFQKGNKSSIKYNREVKKNE